MIRNILSWLAGKKTYLVCILGVAYAFGIWKWHWPNESEIWGALGFSGAMTLRAAIAKLCRQIAEDTIRPPFLSLIFAALTAVAFGVGGCNPPGAVSASYTDPNTGATYFGGVRPADPKDAKP